jgi:hypothetical protein
MSDIHVYIYIYTYTYIYVYTVIPRFNSICLYDTRPIESDFLWYQLISHC